MSKTYQKTTRRDEPDPQDAGDIALLEQVIVLLTEIAASAKEGLLAPSAGVGLQVMYQIRQEDVAALGGPRGRRNPGRAGYRHSAEAGSVTMGGRRIPVTRPRVRAADGSGELHLPGYEPLGRHLDLVAFLVDGVHFGEHCWLSPSGSASTGPSTRCRWPRARQRTRPWSPA